MSEKTVTATLKVKLAPWQVPNFARRAGPEEADESFAIPIKDLDEGALEDMALAWVHELYAKAGRHYCPFTKPAQKAPR